MRLVIRQYGRPVWIVSTRARRNITERDRRRAAEYADHSPAITIGYYDLVLTARPYAPQFDVDAVIEIK